MRGSIRRVLIAAAAGALAPLPGSASEGVVEINQARLTAGGVTAGDTPGAPVTLSQSGSYRLASDLRSLSRAVSVIEITASRVTLDLNGFSVGPCLGVNFPVICPPGSADAIIAAGVEQITVENGRVIGAGRRGIDFSALEATRIERVSVSGSGAGAIHLGPGAIVRDVVAEENDSGVYVGPGSLIDGCVIRDNTSPAIGIVNPTGPPAGYVNCVITGNGTVEAQPIHSSVLDLGPNLCGTDLVCP